MFNISAKGVYGISAVLELVLRHNDGVVQIRDIAENQKIPQHYLEQILIVLKRGGIVRSMRGVQGGYLLARHPQEIRLLEVMELLEGPVEISPENRGDMRFQSIWDRVENSVRDQLDISMDEVAEEIKISESQPDFVI